MEKMLAYKLLLVTLLLSIVFSCTIMSIYDENPVSYPSTVYMYAGQTVNISSSTDYWKNYQESSFSLTNIKHDPSITSASINQQTGELNITGNRDGNSLYQVIFKNQGYVDFIENVEVIVSSAYLPFIGNLTVSAVLPHTDRLKAEWSILNHSINITKYEVLYKKTTENVYQNFTTITTPSTTSATITGLTPGTTYDISINAFKDGDNIPVSISAQKATPTPAVAPDISSLTVQPVNRSDSSLSLSWTVNSTGSFIGGAQASITNFRIEYKQGNSSYHVFANITTSINATTITGLNASTIYDVRVTAHNNVGLHDILTGQGTVNDIGTPPGVPQNLQHSSSQSGEIRLTWQPPVSYGLLPGGDPASIINYRIEWIDSGITKVVSCSPTLGTVSCILNAQDGIVSGHNYTFQVIAVNSVAGGTRGSASTITAVIP